MSLLDFFHRYAEISMGPRPEDLAPLRADFHRRRPAGQPGVRE